jgi:hypothetical protein
LWQGESFLPLLPLLFLHQQGNVKRGMKMANKAKKVQADPDQFQHLKEYSDIVASRLRQQSAKLFPTSSNAASVRASNPSRPGCTRRNRATTIEVGSFAFGGGAKRQKPLPRISGQRVMFYAVRKTDRSFAFAYTRFDELPQKAWGK